MHWAAIPFRLSVTEVAEGYYWGKQHGQVVAYACKFSSWIHLQGYMQHVRILACRALVAYTAFLYSSCHFRQMQLAGSMEAHRSQLELPT